MFNNFISNYIFINDIQKYNGFINNINLVNKTKEIINKNALTIEENLEFFKKLVYFLKDYK